MKKISNKFIIILSIFLGLSILNNKASAVNFKNADREYENKIIVKYGTIINIEKSEDEILTIENNDIAKLTDNNEMRVEGVGHFKVHYKSKNLESDIDFFAWNAYLKKGQYYTYYLNNSNKANKADIILSKVYLAVEQSEKEKYFKIKDYLFVEGGKYKKESELVGKLIKSYYDTKKQKSKNSYYEYSFNENFTAINEVEGINVNNGGTTETTKKIGTISYKLNQITKKIGDKSFINELTNTGDGKVSYSSSNPSVATVDSKTGKVNIKKVGTTEITANVKNTGKYTYQDLKATYTLVVNKNIGNVSFANNIIEKKVNDNKFTNKLTVIGDGKVDYSSSNKDVAIVDKNGKVTINGMGTTIITAKVSDTQKYKYEQQETSYTLNVKGLDPTLKITKDDATVDEGNSIEITYGYIGDGNLKVTSSNGDIASAHLSKNNKIIIKGIKQENAVITISATSGKKYNSISKDIKVKVNPIVIDNQKVDNGDLPYKPIYNYNLSGKLVEQYFDSSIDVKIEEIDGFYVSKIWVKDPSTQLLKADQSDKDWNKTLRNVGELLKDKKNAIVACNASQYSQSPYWTKQSTYGGDWDNTPIGNLVVTNGVIRRKRETKNVETLLGILKDGTFRFFKKAPYENILDAGVVNTFKFSTSYNCFLIENGIRNNIDSTSTAPRTAFGQVDENNYVIIVANAKRGAGNSANYKTYNEVTDIGMELGCKMLFNGDGGGSSTLWFKGKIYFYAQSKASGPRDVGDALYFVSTENK